MSEVAVSGEVMLTQADARLLTDQAKESADALRQALVELYQGDAHNALGYSNWGEYCAAEFGMSERNAWDILDHGRVVRAIESERAGARSELPNQKVARTALARLLPPIKSGVTGTGANRNGSSEKVAEAWDKIVQAKQGSDEPHSPITASFAKSVLVRAGDLPDTKGNTGKPGWRELLGEVGDTLIAADKKLAKLETVVTRRPNQAMVAKAEEYGDWADGLAQRLRGLGA